MNWKRIWTGALLAGLVVFLLDGLINHVFLINTWRELLAEGKILHATWYTVPIFSLQDFGIGFVLTWMYALIRPRTGPGPKTAFLVGTLAWALIAIPRCLFQWLWLPFPPNVTLVTFFGTLVQCWTGTYVAGWQYIERAP